MGHLSHSGRAGAVEAPAHVIISKGDAARSNLETAFRVWSKRYPAELRTFLAEVARRRDTLLNGNGMAPNGEYAAAAVVPVRINILMDKLIPDFWKNGGLQMWNSMFPDLNIRTSKMSKGH